ncbi:MAG TPA: hypothetical protein VK147_06890 [Candidatus Didemnitutus sp.]|nr:hypothetical protein [Candidatus Didemnitutus sp.]
MKHRSRFSSILGLVTLVVLVITGCTDDPVAPAPTPDAPNSSSYTAVYKDGVVVIDSASTDRALISVDSTKRNVVFRTGDAALANIAVGKPLLIWRTAMGTVKSVTPSGGETRVVLEKATLPTIYKNASISYDNLVKWEGATKPILVDAKGMEHVMTQVGPDSFNVEIEWGDFVYKVDWKMAGDNANVTINVEKKVLQGLRARYTLAGTIEKFRTKSTIEITNGTTTQYSVENSNVAGDVKLSLSVIGSGNDAVNFEFPVTLIKIPVNVGPLVVVVNVRVQVVINAVVPPDGSSLIEATFKYKSGTGFKFSQGNILGLGGAGEHKEEKIKAQTGASTPIGVNFGIGFPRLEFKLFDADVLVPWMQTALLVGGDFTTGVHPCQMMKTQFIGAAGVDMQMLGITLKRNTTLWTMEKVHLKTGDCK